VLVNDVRHIVVHLRYEVSRLSELVYFVDTVVSSYSKSLCVAFTCADQVGAEQKGRDTVSDAYPLVNH
jgi:hypothetical protein